MPDRKAELKRLEKRYDDGEITYAKFEELSDGLILTPNQEAAQRDKRRWEQGGGWRGYFLRLLRGLVIWTVFGIVAASGAYLFLGVDFWVYLFGMVLLPSLIPIMMALKDGF